MKPCWWTNRPKDQDILSQVYLLSYYFFFAHLLTITGLSISVSVSALYETDDIQDTRRPSCAVWWRDMDISVMWVEEIGCLPSSMPTMMEGNFFLQIKCYDHVSNQEVIIRTGLSSVGDIISCSHLGLFGYPPVTVCNCWRPSRHHCWCSEQFANPHCCV